MEQKIKIFYALSLGFGMGLIISMAVLAIILGGTILHKRYTTSWPVILGAVVALFVSIFLIYYFVAPFLKKEKQ